MIEVNQEPLLSSGLELIAVAYCQVGYRVYKLWLQNQLNFITKINVLALEICSVKCTKKDSFKAEFAQEDIFFILQLFA